MLAEEVDGSASRASSGRRITSSLGAGNHGEELRYPFKTKSIYVTKREVDGPAHGGSSVSLRRGDTLSRVPDGRWTRDLP